MAWEGTPGGGAPAGLPADFDPSAKGAPVTATNKVWSDPTRPPPPNQGYIDQYLRKPDGTAYTKNGGADTSGGYMTSAAYNNYNATRGAGAPGTPGSATGPASPSSTASTSSTGWWGDGSGSGGSTGTGAPAPTSGALSNPGVGEEWWTSHADDWNKPTASSDYWEGNKGKFNGAPHSNDVRDIASDMHAPSVGETQFGETKKSLSAPSASEGWWDTHKSELDKPTRSGTYADDTSNFFKTPTQGETFFADNKDKFTTPGAAMNYFDDNKSKLAAPSDSEKYFKSNESFFKAPTASENIFNAHGADLMSGKNALSDNAGEVLAETDQARRLGTFFDRNADNLERKSYQEREADAYRPELSNSETLYDSGNPALNKFYDREYQLGSKRINEDAATKGGFNSGASIRGVEELNADLGASHARDMASLAGQADASKMARLGLGHTIYSGADTGLTNRIGLGFEGAQGADTVSLGRAGMKRGLFDDMADNELASKALGVSAGKNATDAAIGRITTGGNIARDASGAAIDRIHEGATEVATGQGLDDTKLFKGTDAAIAAGDQSLDRVGEGSDVVAKGDAADDAKFRTGIEGSHTAAADKLDRERAITDAAYKASELERLRKMGAAGLLSDADKLDLDYLETGSRIAGAADDTTTARLTGGQNAADSTQGLEEKRLGDAFDRILKLAESQGDTYAAQRGEALRAEWQQKEAEIEGLLADNKISDDEAKSRRAELTSYYTTAIQAYASRPPTSPAPAPKAT